MKLQKLQILLIIQTLEENVHVVLTMFFTKDTMRQHSTHSSCGRDQDVKHCQQIHHSIFFILFLYFW